ncbi:hypothetical protein KIN20_001831 [Parelaphostrongylus tenuis]|uniref:Uncharacterized protein n=1 Tax=Parelaphostrongylus tenuis TaxID=148309 RepID=A0AAD5MMQ1_PARTN|nr:hypothetical protein KIN20_001831 [Parelaphostrongylus tenuis]
MIEAVRSLINVVLIFCPLILSWALYGQQFKASVSNDDKRKNGEIFYGKLRNHTATDEEGSFIQHQDVFPAAIAFVDFVVAM